MFVSKEKPYPGCVLISFLCDYDNKNFLVFLADISVWLILAIIKIW